MSEYYKADEIRRLIENWAAWTGDGKGRVYSTSPIAWDELHAAIREQQRARTAVIRPIGAEAQVTGEVLLAMAGKWSRALKYHYTSSLTADMIARDYLHCSRRTFFSILSEAHPDFWQRYSDRLQSSTVAADLQVKASNEARITPRRPSPLLPWISVKYKFERQ